MGIVVIHYRLTVIPMSQSAQWNVIIRVLNVAQLMSNIFFSNKKSNFAVSGCRERFARTARLACRVSTLGGGRKESSNIGAQYCAFDSQGYDAAAALQRRREPSLLCTVEAVEAGYLWLFHHVALTPTGYWRWTGLYSGQICVLCSATLCPLSIFHCSWTRGMQPALGRH